MFENLLNLVMLVFIRWPLSEENYLMITQLPEFQSFFSFSASFCIGQISRRQHKHLCFSPKDRQTADSTVYSRKSQSNPGCC